MIEKIVIGIIISLVLVGSLILSYSSVKLEADCAKIGWPDAKITFYLERYCIKRIDQTDFIEPLSKLLENEKTMPQL